MGRDKIRHVLSKRRADGTEAFFWNPSKTVRMLGLIPEALGTSWTLAKKRADELNAMADEMRASGRAADNGAGPGTTAKLFRDYLKSDEVAALKPRTQKDLRYYLDKIEAEFAGVPVAAISPKVVKEYHKRIMRERSVNWAYHMIWAWRCALSWSVSEDWISENPALKIQIPGPPKRKVVWKAGEPEAFIAQAKKDGWHSIAVAALLLDCTAQSPIDIWKLKVRDYELGRIIDSARAKTGEAGAPIELWPEVQSQLDAYLASRPALHPDAPLLANDRTERAWIESTRYKVIQAIRTAAGLRAELQFQDFRRTAQNEARAAGATVAEIQHLARHASPMTQQRYMQPDERLVIEAQRKRLRYRRRTRKG